MSKKGSSGNQTITQENVPEWAQDYAQDTLAMADAESQKPYEQYRYQRYADPSALTNRGEGILGGRYDDRFGEGGADPFAAANAATANAAGYQSTYQGTMGGTLGQPMNYQGNLSGMQNPNVFQAQNYTQGLPQFSNPNAYLPNQNAGVSNVNVGLQNQNYTNANQGLQGPVNYQQQKSLRDSMKDFQDPYTDSVVNQAIKDMDRARKITGNQISGDAARAGAFGGSRETLMQAENNRNFADRTAAAVGQLRSQGFQKAADLAQRENLQRLAQTASDVQQSRGLQSQGNLAAQGLSAQDRQNVRGLTSQGALAAQGLRSQGALAAQGLESQGALAAQAQNANLYGQGLGATAAADRAAMGYNAGLLSDAMGYDRQDLSQLRNIASNEAQFAENAMRNAGALNLQGGQQLGALAQAGTADERQRIADMLAGGASQDAREQRDQDWYYQQFLDRQSYPGRQIDLRNAALSPLTGSVVRTQPQYQQNPFLPAAGAGLGTYAALAGAGATGYALPLALGMGALTYMNSN